MTHTTDPLLAIDRSLEPAERETFELYVRHNWRQLTGARPADVLELTTSHDMFLGLTEPWFESYREEFADGLPLTAVLHALIILGRELTVLNVTKILLRAGLMPKRESRLTWQAYSTPPMRAVTGYQATGADLHYLVFRHPQGSAYQLIRYPRNGTFTETVIMAASYAVTLDSLDEGRRFADRFEAGEDIAGIGWYHGRAPEGASTT